MDKSNLKVWLNGKMVGYGDAKVPILTHSLQYGSGIFEGIRAYKTESGPAIFRLSDHVRRFIETAKIYSVNLGYGAKEIENAIIEVVLQNKLDSCYIRPFAFYDDDNIGISVANKHVSVYIAAIPFGNYFGDAKNTGIRCKISSWKRINSDILPIRAKASGNYINSIIAGNEARASGYDEAILLSHNGYVAEGPGENLFIVRNGRLLTPGADSDILFGVTRDTIIKIAPRLDIQVVEGNIHKEELYIAEEAFFSGTAAEITPIVNIDGIKIGSGSMGKTTQKISEYYKLLVSGKAPESKNWLTKVK